MFANKNKRYVHYISDSGDTEGECTEPVTTKERETGKLKMKNI